MIDTIGSLLIKKFLEVSLIFYAFQQADLMK